MRILRTLKGCFNDQEFQKDWLVVDGVSEQCRMPLGRANMVTFQDYHRRPFCKDDFVEI